jgi:hypothetical protein
MKMFAGSNSQQAVRGVVWRFKLFEIIERCRTNVQAVANSGQIESLCFQDTIINKKMKTKCLGEQRMCWNR